MVDKLGRPGGLPVLRTEPQEGLGHSAGIPDAGASFTIVYPFVRGTYINMDASADAGEYVDSPTWLPGVEYRDVSAEDTAPFADAEGKCRFTVVAVFKPGRYPTRVFYTRRFVDPDGKEFGKSRLHIATLDKFRRLVVGYRDAYGLGDNPPPERHWSGCSLRKSREIFEELLTELASAAGTRRAETSGLGPQAARAAPERGDAQ